MARRIPLVITLLACAIMAASLALVFALVIAGIVYGGIDIPGEPEIADADALAVSLIGIAA